MMLRMLSCLAWIAVPEHFKTIAVLSSCVTLPDAYNIGCVISWYRLIDMSYILFHVKFEDGLSISLSFERQSTRYKSLELAIEKFLKKSNNFKRRTRHYPAGQSLGVHKIRVRPISTKHDMESFSLVFDRKYFYHWEGWLWRLVNVWHTIFTSEHIHYSVRDAPAIDRAVVDQIS
jgi:hypothetical protein